MKLFILADMEGACGIYSQEHFTVGTKAWNQWGKRCLTEDARAVAEGARSAGAKHITFRDYHTGGFNIIPHELPRYVKITGGQYIRPIPVIGKKAHYDLAFLIAQHSSVDAPGAFYPHIFHHHVKSIEVNGELMSEAEILAAVLGERLNTPVGMISGDPLLLNNLAHRFPWAEFAPCTKNPENFNTPEKTNETLEKEREKLFQKSKLAVERRHGMKIFKIPGPVRIIIELHFPESAVAKNSWGFLRISDTSFCIEAENFLNAYKKLFNFLFIPRPLYPLALGFFPIINFLPLSFVQFLKRKFLWQ